MQIKISLSSASLKAISSPRLHHLLSSPGEIIKKLSSNPTTPGPFHNTFPSQSSPPPFISCLHTVPIPLPTPKNPVQETGLVDLYSRERCHMSEERCTVRLSQVGCGEVVVFLYPCMEKERVRCRWLVVCAD